MEMGTGDRGRWDDWIWCVRCVILGCVFGVPSAYTCITQMKDRERRNLHRLAEASHCSVSCVCIRMYMYVHTYIYICTYMRKSHAIGWYISLTTLSWAVLVSFWGWADTGDSYCTYHLYILIYVCTVNTACTNWETGSINRELLYHFDCFVWHPYV